MKILVCIKCVIDYAVHIRVKSDGSGVETDHVKKSMNPFDAIALEEAVRLKEKNLAAEIIAVSIGDISSQETLRQALALGADRAILIQTAEVFEPLNIAKILQKTVEKEKPDIVFLGKQAIDGDHNQTGQMLAGLLDWSQGTFISALSVETEGQLFITREIDGGLETLRLDLPAVLTADLRLNEPRYASLPNIMKARSKPLEIFDLSEYIDKNLLSAHTKILNISSPPARKAGVILNSTEALLEKLKFLLAEIRS